MCALIGEKPGPQRHVDGNEKREFQEISSSSAYSYPFHNNTREEDNRFRLPPKEKGLKHSPDSPTQPKGLVVEGNFTRN